MTDERELRRDVARTPTAAGGMKRFAIVHPVLFALFPILFLYAHNMSELYLLQLAAPLLIAGGAAAIVWLALALAMRDARRAALVSSLFWVWFFCFGRLHALAEPSRTAALTSPRTLAFVAGYGIVLLVAAAVLGARRRWTARLSSALNIMALALVAWNVVTIGAYEFQRAQVNRRVARAGGINAAAQAASQVHPNIYHIVLDAYGRADVLRKIYHYDNSEFLNYLKDKGFHIARRGKANYCETVLSTAATLNLDYLDTLVAQAGLNAAGHKPTDWDILPACRAVAHNKLFDFLRKRGYRIVTFAVAYPPLDLRTADIYMSGASGLSEFQESILNTTPLPLLFMASGRERPHQPYASQIMYIFNHLPDTTKLKPPIFVFAHILCPHPPFVFDHNGRVMAPEKQFNAPIGSRLHGAEGSTGYIEQVRFVNHKIKETVDYLLANQRWPSVIIIQSDHGPSARTNWWPTAGMDPRERLAALMACYLPGGGKVQFDDDLSGVNIYRMVLNRYFGANLPLLSNECYFSCTPRPFEFTRVTNQVDAGLGSPAPDATSGASPQRRRGSGPAGGRAPGRPPS
jgi:hypothetical protein